MGNRPIPHRVPQHDGARFAGLFDEYPRDHPRLAGGLLGRFANAGTGGQLVQPGAVLLGDVVVRGRLTNPVQHDPGLQVAAQFDQRLYQAVHGLDLVGEQLQDGLVDLGCPFPLALKGEVHRLAVEVPLQPGAAGCPNRIRVHSVSCPAPPASGPDALEQLSSVRQGFP